MEITNFTHKYVERTMELIKINYNKERKALPMLPQIHTLPDTSIFADNGLGVVATDEGRVVGFLGGYEVKEHFGKCKGIYMPAFGHGAEEEKQKQIYQRMYEYAADFWVQRNIMTHSLTVYAQDQGSVNTWFSLGFGMRCVDSIRQAEPICENNGSITIKKAEANDIPSFAPIHRKLHLYFRNSPIFMPMQEEDPIEKLKAWMAEDSQRHLWIAYLGEKPVGYMRIQPEGESFISLHQDIMNITGAYVEEEYRKLNIGALLLDTIQRWLQQNNFPLCGVDFESINIIGSRFWDRHFTPYTYGLVRRIDERILEG